MERKEKPNIEGLVDIFLKKYFYLEAVTTDFIIYYMIESDFSKDGDRRNEFYDYFLEKLTFDRKEDILLKIVKKSYPQYQKLFSKLNFQCLRYLRNLIAHSIVEFKVDQNDSTKSKIIFQYYYKRLMFKYDYTYKRVEKHISLCSLMFDTLEPEVKRMQRSSEHLEGLVRAMRLRSNAKP